MKPIKNSERILQNAMKKIEEEGEGFSPKTFEEWKQANPYKVNRLGPEKSLEAYNKYKKEREQLEINFQEEQRQMREREQSKLSEEVNVVKDLMDAPIIDEVKEQPIEEIKEVKPAPKKQPKPKKEIKKEEVLITEQKPEPIKVEQPTQPIEDPFNSVLFPAINPEQKPEPIQGKTPKNGEKILNGFINILNSEKLMEKLTGEALSQLVIILISKIKK